MFLWVTMGEAKQLITFLAVVMVDCEQFLFARKYRTSVLCARSCVTITTVFGWVGRVG
jgi:hypothetical protein